MKSLTILAVAYVLSTIPVFSEIQAEGLAQLDTMVQSLVDSGMIVGAQIAVAQHDHVLLNKDYGVRSEEDGKPVDSETLFCIGSCSKPVASAVIMTLVDDGVLSLEKNIEAWLPSFGSLKTSNGKPARSPNLGELLSHHGGIYSQKKGMTQKQSRWIRDFRLSLERAVEGIAREPLLANPGEQYAYSGAGYCVLGRVAEAATNLPFEELLQARLCKSLNLVHTTYFPDSDNANIASGSLDGEINQNTPHLSQPFELPLIGGSLYSTAEESLRFLQAVSRQATSGNEVLMSNEQFGSYTTPYSSRKNYAFGWSVMIKDGTSFGLRHSGALASSRVTFQINNQKGICLVILYTVSDPGHTCDVTRALGTATRPLIEPID